MKKVYKIIFVILLGNFCFNPFLHARYDWKWNYGNFPVQFHIPIDLKNETLLQKTFRATMIMCFGALVMQGGYEAIKKRNEFPIFLSLAIFCGGGFLCAHAAALYKHVYENLGNKELI